MRILLVVRVPHEPFNTLTREGSIGTKMQAISDQIKPEAVYFTEFEGIRTWLYVVKIQEASQIPSFAEPFFLTFEADVEFHVLMTPDDLQKAELEKLGKHWS